jgi:hypothetical protein
VSRLWALAAIPVLLAVLLSGSAGRALEALPGAPGFPPAVRARLEAALAKRPADAEPRTRHRLPDGSPRYVNRLLLEASPYLRQHAHNPVNWYAWGDEAFAAARELGRPVFVSIGYATCHWCHVMEEESFDDAATAELLNRHFVAVKVDREIRPDLDAIYLSALEAMGRQGGWPLNVWLAPDRRPFFGGTYFAPADAPGRPGFRRVLETLQRLWSEDRQKLEGQAAVVSEAVADMLEAAAPADAAMPDEVALRGALDAFHAAFDPEWGGLRRAPKFPIALPVRLLLRIHRRSGDPRALDMAVLTLEKMAAGGLRDHVGGGFHRYATDARWLVPHFEKMLYDQALLAVAYTEGWQVTGRDDFAQVARETLDQVAREMTDPRGGFYAATDADSAGPDGRVGEGVYFTWTPAELEAAAGPDLAPIAAEWFGVTAAGDLDGRSVLRTWRRLEDVAAARGLAPAELSERLARAREALRRAREERPPPLRDDKLVTAWNGLMIGAFARAALAFDEPRYAHSAARAAEFALSLRRDGRLARAATDAGPAGPAFLEDYAFLVGGLLDLYEAAPDPRWIAEARALQAAQDAHYASRTGAYWRAANDAEALIAREKPDRDDAIPSGNAVAALNLLRLAALTGDERQRERALAIFRDLGGGLSRNPAGRAELLIALDFALDTSKEVLVVAPAPGTARPLLDVLRRRFVPNRVLASVTEGAELDAHAEQVPLLRYKKARDGRATAYVCENRVCRLPTTDPAVFEEQLVAVDPLGGGAERSAEAAPGR